MSKKFILQGNRSCIRSDDEMLSVDKTAAGSAFKKCGCISNGEMRWDQAVMF